MTTFKAICRELFALFVDDDSFALAVIAVVGLAGVFKIVFHASGEIVGTIIALGCLAALIESVTRASRKT
jgi:hypothetical protein